MRLLIAIFAVLCLAGCVDTPVQSSQVVDDRPRLTFDTSLLGDDVSAYEVVIDGVNYGSINQYQTTEATMRIVSGSHKISVVYGGQVVYETKVYLGENSTRVIKVTPYD